MTKVTISDGKLVIDVKGWDKLWSLVSRLEIPLDHVNGVRAAPDESPEGIRLPGTHIPGLIAAGTFIQSGESVFWDVHNPENAIAIDLIHEHFSSLVVEVADPEATIREILNAFGRWTVGTA